MEASRRNMLLSCSFQDHFVRCFNYWKADSKFCSHNLARCQTRFMRSLYMMGLFYRFFDVTQKMVRHTQAIRWQHSANCLSVFDHFMRLLRQGLKLTKFNPNITHFYTIFSEIFPLSYLWPYLHHKRTDNLIIFSTKMWKRPHNTNRCNSDINMVSYVLSFYLF